MATAFLGATAATTLKKRQGPKASKLDRHDRARKSNDGANLIPEVLQEILKGLSHMKCTMDSMDARLRRLEYRSKKAHKNRNGTGGSRDLDGTPEKSQKNKTHRQREESKMRSSQEPDRSTSNLESKTPSKNLPDNVETLDSPDSPEADKRSQAERGEMHDRSIACDPSDSSDWSSDGGGWASDKSSNQRNAMDSFQWKVPVPLLRRLETSGLTLPVNDEPHTEPTTAQEHKGLASETRWKLAVSLIKKQMNPAVQQKLVQKVERQILEVPKSTPLFRKDSIGRGAQSAANQASNSTARRHSTGSTTESVKSYSQPLICTRERRHSINVPSMSPTSSLSRLALETNKQDNIAMNKVVPQMVDGKEQTTSATDDTKSLKSMQSRQSTFGDRKIMNGIKSRRSSHSRRSRRTSCSTVDIEDGYSSGCESQSHFEKDHDDVISLDESLFSVESIRHAQNKMDIIHSILDSESVQPPSPFYVKLSTAVSLFMMIVVVVSCVVFCIETLPHFHGTNNLVLAVLEYVCIAIFTVEFIARFVTSPFKRSFFKKIMNIIDILAVLPFYLTLILPKPSDSNGSSPDTVFVLLRVLRLTRVLRVLKLSKHNEGMQDIGATILASRDAFSLLAFMVMTMTILFSSAMYFAEQMSSTWDPETRMWITESGLPSKFQSVPQSFWWCIITLTTVGYGDAVPQSLLGRLLGSLATVCGILVIALPTMILSANFQQVREYNARRREKAAAIRQFALMAADEMLQVTQRGRASQMKYENIELEVQSPTGTKGSPRGPTPLEHVPVLQQKSFKNTAELNKNRQPTYQDDLLDIEQGSRMPSLPSPNCSNKITSQRIDRAQSITTIQA